MSKGGERLVDRRVVQQVQRAMTMPAASVCCHEQPDEACLLVYGARLGSAVGAFPRVGLPSTPQLTVQRVWLYTQGRESPAQPKTVAAVFASLANLGEATSRSASSRPSASGVL